MKDNVTYIPSSIEANKELSPEAIETALFIYSMPKDWRITPDKVMKRFSIVPKVWRRISRELRAAGIMAHRHTSKGGRLTLNRTKLTQEQLEIGRAHV